MPKTDLLEQGRPSRGVAEQTKVVTVGEVFTFNHYPERLTEDQKLRIGADFLNSEPLVASHKRRSKRDDERTKALKSFVARHKG